MLSDLFSGKKSGSYFNNGSTPKTSATETALSSSADGIARLDGITARWIEITPQYATLIIDSQNTQNRKYRPSRIRQLARAMERGVFRITHQSIAFDRNGTLIDGQHRLRAIILSGKSITLLVVEGLDPIVRASTDLGVARTPSDMLKIVGGEERAALVAKAIGSIRRVFSGGSERLDWDELNEHRKVFANGLDWAVANVTNHKKISSGPVVGALVFAYRKHPELIPQIYAELESGGSPPGDPIQLFRDLLLSSSIQGEQCAGVIFQKLLTAIWHRARGSKPSKLFATAEAKTYFEKAYR